VDEERKRPGKPGPRKAAATEEADTSATDGRARGGSNPSALKGNGSAGKRTPAARAPAGTGGPRKLDEGSQATAPRPGRTAVVKPPRREPLIQDRYEAVIEPRDEAPPPMEATRWTLLRAWGPYAALAIPVSSLLGLMRAMLAEGAHIWLAVWAANFWADLLFAVGTAGAVLATAYVAYTSRTAMRFVSAVVLGFLLHAFLYMASFGLASTAGPLVRDFASFHLADADLSDAGEIVWYGLPGLVTMAFAGPLLGLYLPRSEAPKYPEDA
jgi:hypothetical protein